MGVSFQLSLATGCINSSPLRRRSSGCIIDALQDFISPWLAARLLNGGSYKIR
jgi:hypothetical protein